MDTYEGLGGPGLRRLETLCAGYAMLGGAMLLATTVITLVSVLARYFFAKPLVGDFELVQVAVATCIASFLPYCQLKGGNIIVDFFTTGMAPSRQRAFDALGALLLSLMMLVLGWRAAVGATSVFESGESSMLMSIPIWITYALIVPGFLLTCFVALVDARRRLATRGTGGGDE